jgi:hypothetical protein
MKKLSCYVLNVVLTFFSFLEGAPPPHLVCITDTHFEDTKSKVSNTI